MSTESKIRAAAAEVDQTQIASRMESADGKRIDRSTVSKYLSGAGIPLDRLEAFLGALGFKVVAEDEVTIPRDEYRATLALAERGLAARRREMDE